MNIHTVSFQSAPFKWSQMIHTVQLVKTMGITTAEFYSSFLYFTFFLFPYFMFCLLCLPFLMPSLFYMPPGFYVIFVLEINALVLYLGYLCFIWKDTSQVSSVWPSNVQSVWYDHWMSKVCGNFHWEVYGNSKCQLYGIHMCQMCGNPGNCSPWFVPLEKRIRVEERPSLKIITADLTERGELPLRTSTYN